ncbi:MAG: STAS domain-containing protein [Gammaproteobacteria bacterium]
MNDADIKAGLVIDPSGQIQITGVLDYDTVPALLAQYRTQLASLPVWEIDLANVERSNSAGLALLITWLREARQQEKPVRLLNIPEQMLQIARVSDLEEMLNTESV